MLKSVKILSTGIYLPRKVLTNQEISQTVETSDKWISERTGIRERRIADPKDELPSDMAYHATLQALEAANLKANDIDLILFATCFPDTPIPNAACYLQKKLGITNYCGAIDIQAACSGFVYGMNMAAPMLQTGMAKHVLIVGSEFLSVNVDWQDRSTCILFGDGCGVAILGTDSAQQSQILSSVLGADGEGIDLLKLEHGGPKSPITKEIIDARSNFMQMNGKEIFKTAVRTLSDNAHKCLKQAQLTIDDIDWVVPHQANLRIIEATMHRIGVPKEKVIVNIEKYGNTSAATVPIAFHEAVQAGKIKRGDIVLFDAFGAGLTSGATLFRY